MKDHFGLFLFSESNRLNTTLVHKLHLINKSVYKIKILTNKLIKTIITIKKAQTKSITLSYQKKSTSALMETLASSLIFKGGTQWNLQ